MPRRAVPAPPGVLAGAAREAPPETLRFAALGDSLTEGLGDPLADGTRRGWAALLAEGLPAPGQSVRLVNLARSGAQTADAAGEQLAAARRMRPHVASVVVGVNDTLRGTYDIPRAVRALDTAIGTLTADGTVVLTACLPDPGRMLRLPRALARPLGRRMRALNEAVHQLSRRHGAVHAHLADHPMVSDRDAWSVDRLHPSELGHRLLAREFHALLAERGLAEGPQPSFELDQEPPTRTAGVWWMATRGTRWVVARSVDLLPGLLGLALEETRHRLAGTDGVLERTARDAVREALRRTVPSASPGALNGAQPTALSAHPPPPRAPGATSIPGVREVPDAREVSSLTGGAVADPGGAAGEAVNRAAGPRDDDRAASTGLRPGTMAG